MSVPTMFAMPKNLLFSLGLPSAENTFYQLSPDELINQCLERKEGVLNSSGALVINTGKFTGRSPKDRFIVKDKITEKTIGWNSNNQSIDEGSFDHLYKKIMDHLGKKTVWIRDSYVCAGANERLNVRSINEDPAGNLFTYNMFLHPQEKESDSYRMENFNPDWYIIHAPAFFANPKTDGTRQGNFTIINFAKKLILIGGSAYTEEIKKWIFSILGFERKNKKQHFKSNEGLHNKT